MKSNYLKLSLLASSLFLAHQANAEQLLKDSNFFAKKDNTPPVVKQNTAKTSIYDVSTSTSNDNATQIKISFNGLPTQPKAAKLSDPDRLILDFGNIDYTVKGITIPKGKEINGLQLSKAPTGNTLLTVNLGEYSNFTSKVEGSVLIIKVYPKNYVPSAINSQIHKDSGVKAVNYSRTRGGEDQVIIDLDSDKTPISIKRENEKIIVNVLGVRLADHLLTKRSFNDARAVVSQVNVSNDSKNSGLIEIKANGNFEYTAMQVDKRLVINFARINTVHNAPDTKKNNYIGRKITMDFQDVDTRRVLQMIATYTDANIVISDSIRSNLSIKLDNVPWDQALNVIAKSKGLGQRRDGKIIWIAPNEELSKFEQAEAQSEAQSVALADIKSELIQLNYATAADVEKLLRPQKNRNNGDQGAQANPQLTSARLDVNGDNSGSLLSPRGTVSVDSRTNTLIISDTSRKIAEIRRLIAEIDVPVKQVMVEARIVHTSTDFSKALGVRWGFMKSTGVSAAGNLTNLNKIYNNQWKGTSDKVTDDNVNLDLGGVVDSIGTSSIALGLINTSSTLLGLELSAMQENGLGEILSSPKVMTGDKQAALIRSGAKIPYKTTSENNGTTTTFQDAVLELKVTPSITPDGKVQMKLEIMKDTIGALTDAGYVIDTNQLTTNVLVENGETVVLGGLYEDTTVNMSGKVPVLGDVPVVGNLFKNKSTVNKKKELLIFITPAIETPKFK